jgi:mannose-6-phosphate isomerase-like protein (cupin superfamily)
MWREVASAQYFVVNSLINPMKKISIILLAAVLGVVVSSVSSFAAEPPPTEVVVIEHGKVENGFAKGMPLLINSSYKIQAGRRVVAPGESEIHEHDTDIFYITEGHATFVTGGEIEGGKTTAAGEIRGKAIVGGVERKLEKGDVVVIPAGVPHWFKDVSNPFLYLIVKVTK